jgi:broad specificity phosphatase PhoE
VSAPPAGAVPPQRVVLVRHGNTFGPGDVVTRVGARTDLPLVASGLRQAEALGAHFLALGMQFDVAFCSTLRRTRETAEALLRVMGQSPPLTASAALTEIDHGPDENQPEDQVLSRIGAQALHLWETQAIPPPGWVIDLAATANAWRALHATAAPGETRLLVTSNGTSRFALAACGAGLLPKLRTGAYGVFAFAEDGAATVETWDQRPPA